MNRPSLRLLVVDDNPADREFITEAVAEYGHGFDLVLATNIAEAELAAAKDPPAELALVDLFLGRENGLDLVRRLRIPVIILSTTDDPIEREVALAAGARAFLVKPVQFEGYRDLLEKARQLAGMAERR